MSRVGLYASLAARARADLVKRFSAPPDHSPPDSIELAHFTFPLDVAEPDLRGVVRAVVSSREYFDQ